jgi:hypothetical protein
MNTEWNETAQARRRDRLFHLHREWAGHIFEPDGTYRLVSDRWNPRLPDERRMGDPRVRAWHAFAFFAGNPTDIRLANAILRKTDFSPDYDFFVCGLIQLWKRHREAFEPDILERTEACLRACGPAQISGAGFVGLNDNFPAMSTLILVLAGEHTGRPELVGLGVARMRELVGRLDRDGTIAEFNSPTYLALTMACMADLANYAETDEARRLALRIEQQIWFDVCARFHPGTSQMGGPTSRSYTADSCGHMHNTRYVLNIAFGSDLVFINHERYAFADDSRLSPHHDDPMFNAANGVWVAAADFHVPDACGRMMIARAYPFEVTGTASCAFAWQPDDWRVTDGAREKERFRSLVVHRYAPVLLTTYHTEDYSVASSSGAHACGDGAQHDAFFVAYRRRRPEATSKLTLDDMRTVYARYVFNESQPSSVESLLPDQGRKTCVQQGPVALVLYRPGIGVLNSITSMRLTVVLPTFFNEPDQVWLGDRRLETLEGESPASVPIFVRDGMTWLAFRPLALTDYGRRLAVRVRRVERFLTLDFYNYEGAARALNFSYQAPLFTQNGFAFEIATEGEGISFDAFRRRVSEARIDDDFKDCLRRVSYRRDGVDLRIHYDPTNDGVIPAAWINGQSREMPRFRATGLNEIPW